MARIKLWEIAHARTGDKGDTLNVSLIPYDERDYELLHRVVTADRVREHFFGVVQGQVVRYELPRIGAFNFVMEKALCGGVTSSLALDAHGKCLSSLLLDMEIDV